MYTTYVLRNLVTKRYYIGSTNNIERRLSEHNRGQNKSTKQTGKWILLYKEEYANENEAKRRERVIKSYKSGNAFRKLLSTALTAAVVQR